MAKANPLMRPDIVAAEYVTPKDLQWLWYPYIPRGMPVMLDGDPGIGKSMAILQIAASLSLGYPFPDQIGGMTMAPDIDGPSSTLILSAEDSLEHVMVPRLNQAKADLTHIRFLRGWFDPKGGHHSFDLQHMPVLIEAIETVKPVLVVLDPLVAYLGQIDMHRSTDTRPLMEHLRVVAEKYHCTILGVRHPSKLDQGGPLIYRGQGNIDIVGAARSALWVQKHPTHPETKSLMLHSKTNIAMFGRTAIFSREYGDFRWDGMSRLTESMFTGKGPDPYAFLEAFFWLEETRKPYMPYPAKDLDDEAEKRDISRKVLNRAMKALGIRYTQESDGSKVWTLPPLSHLHNHNNITRSTGLTGLTGSTGSTGYSEPESTTYITANGHNPVNPVTPVNPVPPVDPVVSREPYECCGTTLTHNQKVCFQCGKPRQAATI